MNGVSTAPPTIAITSREPPSFVSSPSPRSPIAKIVGNISDMKKLVRKIAHMPSHPGWVTPIDDKNHIGRLYIPMRRPGLTNRISHDDPKRPTANATSEPVKKYPAVFPVYAYSPGHTG